MDWLQDVRYAARGLWRSPGVTLTAIATLGIGIGVNATVVTLTNAVLFKGFSGVERNDRTAYLSNGRGCCVSYPDFEDWRAQAKSFQGMAIVHGIQKSYSDAGSGFPETYNTTEVSADTFRIAGQKPVLGRDFSAADEVPGASPVAILRYEFWEQRYGKDPAILGRVVRINGEPTTVIGVMPRGFSFPQNQELWVPLTPAAELRKRQNRDLWFVFARLADGATIDTARAEMETIGRRLGGAYPLTNQGQNLIPRVQTFHEFFIGPNATMIYEAMLGAVVFVLLIACANLGNLLLARGMARSREISVRIALGAGRWRIVRMLLVESILLSAMGGAAGWWIAQSGVRIFALFANGPAVSDTIGGTWFDHVLDYSADAHVSAYLVAISIGTGLLFGLFPARRLSKIDVSTAMKDGGRGATRGRLSSLLVAGEMALAVVLLAGAGVMIRSFLKVYRAEMGVRMDHVLTALIGVRDSRAEAWISFHEKLAERLETIPGVESVAVANVLPANGARRVAYEIAGAEPVEEQSRTRVASVTVSPGYFRALGTALIAGREFTDFDNASGAPVAIVNQRFAEDVWPGEAAIGKRLRLSNGKWMTVAGVAPNIVENDMTRQRFDPVVYVPFRQNPAKAVWFLVRTSVPPSTLANAFRREMQALDPDLPTAIGPTPLSEYLAWGYQYRGTSGVLFLVFATIALVLAAVGLYAVIAHAVSQRTQEIGIRIAVGATGRDILRLVFAQGMLPLAGGLTIGLAASLGVNRVLQSLLVHVSAADPVSYAVTCGALIAAAMLGCWIPARRAMRVDPMVALRHE
ncbi:MAG: ABC transporter permease [Acidobacteriia bacterium]|nr:ABC transporter permease [Terriglobia bacterium]